MILTNLNGSIAKINGLLDSSQGEIVAIMRNIRSTSTTLDKVTKRIERDPMGFLGGKRGNDAGAAPGPEPAAALP